MTRKLIAITLISTYATFYSQVGINTASPDPSSILDVHSDTKGMLLPRLSTAAVNSLSMSASEGLIVFDKDLKTFVGWDGTKWINLGYEEINTVPTATNLNITGNYSIGSVLTANYTFSDAQSNPDDASAFIWKRADDAVGANTVIIPSATAQNYTLATADQAKFLQFCVTPGSTVGASPGAQKCSAWAGPVIANQAPTASGLNIAGNLAVGQTLTGSYTYNDTEGNPQGSSVFRWTRADDASGSNETTISGATSLTYSTVTGDVGKYIKFYVTPIATTGTTTGTEVGSAPRGPVVTLNTGTISSQSFESGETANYTTSGSGLSIKTGNSSTSDVPANSPFFSVGASGLGFSANSTSSVVFNTVDASSYTNNITFSVDVAAFSIGSTGNGMETGDTVVIEVSTDGGTSYTPKLTLQGGNAGNTSNVRWAFSGTGSATNDFASSNLNVTSSNTSTTNGVTVSGAEAITKLSVTGIPNSSQLRIRIRLTNSGGAELWVIDNARLQAL